jgi:hypothetical protein
MLISSYFIAILQFAVTYLDSAVAYPAYNEFRAFLSPAGAGTWVELDNTDKAK